MAKVNRSLDAGTQAAIAAQHTQPTHLVKITVDWETADPFDYFFSEGPEITFNGDVYVPATIKVGSLSWNGEGEQSCTIELMNEENSASEMFFDENFYDAVVTIWTTYLNLAGANTTPVLYAVGGVDSTQLDPTSLKVTVITQKLRTSFAPKLMMGPTDMGGVGFGHIPPDGSVVIWNEGTYVLERSSG